MNTSSENFDSTFNSLENFNNINTPLTENFSWIQTREPKTMCGGVYCGIPMEKAFAKYENRNFTRVSSTYGFNAPKFNEKKHMSFKSFASKLDKDLNPRDKRGFTSVESPYGFGESETIKGLSTESKKSDLSSSEYGKFRKSTNASSEKSTQKSSVEKSSSSSKASVAASIVSSFYPKKSSVKPRKLKKIVSSVKSSSVKSSSVPSSSPKSSSVPSSSPKSSSVKSSSVKSSSVKSSSVKSSVKKSKKDAKKVAKKDTKK